MIKRTLLFVILGFGLSLTKAISQNLDAFQKKLDSVNMSLEIPEAYEEVETKKNRQLHYRFAMKDQENDFEVRYGLYVITKKQVEEHKACEADPNCHSMDPNYLYKSLMMAHVSNMTGGKSNKFQSFKNEWIRHKLGADRGVISAIFKFDCAFGQGYKYGQIIIIHRDNTADAAIVFLGNNQEAFTTNRSRCFQALKFK